ncbi:nucleotide exchange factor GrpE [Actinoallomurus iriomotensis]|uniref:Protein GrpE n=1 Tax=Actinoallomurus iriomotensis TaxID=478107 RepID=A0A9W6RZB0_9ACTN|nr:nucleotide exchange factor GrpE [Actinoallomurus iriomotensis]GLY85556.1 protein GrpE [Actinoallomurus iriomotensis]
MNETAGGGTGEAGPPPREPRTWPPDPAVSPTEAPAEAAGPGMPGPMEDAEEVGEDIAAKVAELEDRWRRALADLDNYRKRTVRALDEERDAERARTTARWLPVLDNLERAVEHAGAEPGAVVQGVRAVLDQARDVIARLGYPRQDDVGVPFDPFRHEAVSTLAGTGAPEGTVVAVTLPGYGEGPRQLRPAQVVVAREQSDGPAP